MPIRTKEEEWKRSMEWNEKQAKQRIHTLNLKKVLHDSERREQLRNEAKQFDEQAKMFKDLIEDGR